MALDINLILFIAYQSVYTLLIVIKSTFISIYNLIVPYKYRAKSIRGETILVTGSGSGIGKLMSKRFAKLGAKLVLVDIDEKANEKTANEILMTGGMATAFKCDLSKKEDIYRVAGEIKKKVGDVNILINNAGIVTGKKFIEASDESIEKTIAVNTMAHFWMVKSFLPSMIEKNHGHIVTIASVAGIFGSAGLCDYSASKGATIAFDDSLRIELVRLKKSGVHTTCVCPYMIDTGMFQGASAGLIPALKPEYVADKIVEAVLTNQTILFLPRLFYLAYFFKGFVSTDVEEHISTDFFKSCYLMDGFVGRTKAN